MTSAYALIAAGVVLNASAQLLLKAGTLAVGRFDFAAASLGVAGLRLAAEPHIVAGMLCYAVSLVVWIMGLSRVDVTVAYPMLSVGYVLNAVAAWYLFGEALGPMRLAGIGFIIVGVVVIANS